jgi:hypothetical protein
MANGKAPTVFATSEKFLLQVEGLNDARTLLADVFRILLALSRRAYCQVREQRRFRRESTESDGKRTTTSVSFSGRRTLLFFI